MRLRPQAWLDRWTQFVGRDGRDANWPVSVAVVQDGRGISSREAAPYQCFGQTTGNPTAGRHWFYTFTPAIPSRAFTLRLCWGIARVETATSLIGVRIGTATAKAATTACFPIGDLNQDVGGSWTIDEVLNANVPVTLFNVAQSSALGAPTFFPQHAYPEYFLEAVIPPGQVLELLNRTVDDAFDLMLGYYGVPVP